MKTLFIISNPPYGTERAYNALRLAANLAKRDGEEVKLFLVGDAASCAKGVQTTPNGFYNIERMLKSVGRREAEIGVCGTCMDARGMKTVRAALRYRVPGRETALVHPQYPPSSHSAGRCAGHEKPFLHSAFSSVRRRTYKGITPTQAEERSQRSA